MNEEATRFRNLRCLSSPACTRGGYSSQFSDLELGANAFGVCDAAVEMAMKRVKLPGLGGKQLFDNQVVLTCPL